MKMQQIGELIPGIMAGMHTVEKGYTSDFEAFWKHYPKKIGKQNAFKQWKKCKKLPPVEKLIGIIGNQVTYKAKLKEKGEFVPNFPDCERWIKWARWEDEVPIITVSTAKPMQAFVKCKFCQALYSPATEHRCEGGK